MVCQLQSFGVGSVRLTVSRRFELSVTPKKVVSRGFRQGPYRITHILLPNAECIAGAPLMSWSIQISKMILPTIFRFVGLGLKALPRLFRPRPMFRHAASAVKTFQT